MFDLSIAFSHVLGLPGIKVATLDLQDLQDFYKIYKDFTRFTNSKIFTTDNSVRFSLTHKNN